MLSPAQQATAGRNKKIVIGLGVIAFGLWIALVLYIMTENKNAQVTTQPSIVTVHSPSPVATNNMPTANFHYSSPKIQYQTTYSTPKWSLPSTPLGSSSMRIHQTSDASVHSVGGGGNSFGIATTNGHSNQGKGINYTAVAYSGAIYIPTVSNAITEVGAREAGDVSQQKIGAPIRRQVMTDDGEYPEDRPDPVPDETPIGDVTWWLMALLAAAYATMCVARRVRREGR